MKIIIPPNPPSVEKREKGSNIIYPVIVKNGGGEGY